MFVEVFLGYRHAFCTRGQSREMLYGGRRLSTVVAILDDDEKIDQNKLLEASL
jgi:hypothetical protein